MSNNDRPSSDFNRRDFLRGGSLATVMALLGGVPLIAQEQKGEAEKPAGPTVKCAVIGSGIWGREIINTLLRVPQAELVMVCDNYKSAARRGGTLAPGAKTTDDYKTILADKDITAVIVATPTHLHKDIALAAIKAGKHVYCEAPLAHTVEDARAIAQAGKEASKLVFQAGLQDRSDPQRKFVLDFVRSGALGKWVKIRTQRHKKQSWSSSAPTPEREKDANWRLQDDISTGLAGELGIHPINQASWFLNALPKSVIGSGRMANEYEYKRDVPDTVHASLEFRDKVPCHFEATIANSFEAAYEVYYGSDSAVLIRDNKAWMFKEVDAPLLGWEVYAKKEQFHEETGISLKLGASKAVPADQVPTPDELIRATPLYSALAAFVGNAGEVSAAVEDFMSYYPNADDAAVAKNVAELKLRPAASWKDGLTATVMAIKTNEAIVKGEKVAFQKDWFELA